MRIANIDAPEKKQSFGIKSLSFTMKELLNKEVDIEVSNEELS